MYGAYKLLRHIEDGDPIVLSETAMTNSFIHLLKHRLLILRDNRIFLTEKGKAVKENILKKLAEHQKHEMASFSDDSIRRSRFLFLVSFILFLIVSLILLGIILFGFPQNL